MTETQATVLFWSSFSLIVIALGLALWGAYKGRAATPTGAVFVALVALALMRSPSLQEVTLGAGAIKLYAQEAKTDAAEVRAIRDELRRIEAEASQQLDLAVSRLEQQLDAESNVAFVDWWGAREIDGERTGTIYSGWLDNNGIKYENIYRVHVQGVTPGRPEDVEATRCTDEARGVAGRAAGLFPEFPFPHVLLAICSVKLGMAEHERKFFDIAAPVRFTLRVEKARAILQKTTQVPGHHPSHDEALLALETFVESLPPDSVWRTPRRTEGGGWRIGR